jgi:hypothetical protein
MKATKMIWACIMFGALSAGGQGRFLFFNASAPTRIGSIDGPLAGPGIWAQMLAGATSNSLDVVGDPLEHARDGVVGGAVYVTAPTVPCAQVGFVQMVAWDGRLWGTALASVPSDQLGRTDTVRVFMSCDPMPVGAPRFTLPAIVPVPEPAVFTLCVGGGWLLFFCRRLRFRRKSDCVADGTGPRN